MLFTFSKEALNLAPTPHGKYIADEIKLPCLLSSHQNFQIMGQYFNVASLEPQQSPFPETILDCCQHMLAGCVHHGAFWTVFDEIPASPECPTVDTAREHVLTAVQKDAPDLTIKVQDAKRYAHKVRIADAPQSQHNFFAVTGTSKGDCDCKEVVLALRGICNAYFAWNVNCTSSYIVGRQTHSWQR